MRRSVLLCICIVAIAWCTRLMGAPSGEPPKYHFKIESQPLGTALQQGGWVEDAALPNCVVMTHVIKESPADRAGMVAGDIIIEMGGKPIPSSEEMRLRVIEDPGPLIFKVERQGRIREVRVELFDQPARGPNSVVAAEEKFVLA